MSQHIVIIGAGQAGVACAAKLRALAPQSLITIIGEEAHLPYQRPPLSKAFLSGELPAERLTLKPQNWFEDQSIRLITAQPVQRIDRQAQRVHLANSDTLHYDKLVLCTGSRPRPLPQSIAPNQSRLYTLRGIDDARALQHELHTGRRALVIGGGYVGLEFAASASKAGLSVTLVEAAERILARVSSAATADYFRQLHTQHGVNILEGVTLEALSHEASGIRASLSNGQQLEADFIVVGIGALANDQLGQDCGLACQNGILINTQGQSSDAHIYAAGDCATLQSNGLTRRIESVQNAIEQGETAAYSVLALPAPPSKTPWFWSDQYDAKLQIAGLNTGYQRTEVKPGKRPDAQSVWYYAGDTLLAVDAINDPVTYMTVRRQLDAQTPAT